MPRYIKTTHPAVNSFAFLTPQEALEKYGGGFSLVGSPRPAPTPTPATPTAPTAKKPKGKNRKE